MTNDIELNNLENKELKGKKDIKANEFKELNSQKSRLD